MSMIEMDYSYLHKALARLTRAEKLLHTNYAKNIEIIESLQGGTIQAFEFTYELSIKMMRKFLITNALIQTSESELTFPELIRKAKDYGLIYCSLEQWREFRKMRGSTSHTYDENIAIETLSHIPNFIKEIEYLCKKLT